jgi:hypothetical protein
MVAKKRHIRVGVMPTLRACGARPSEGGQTQRGWPHGGKPGDNAEGVFLGGARSPRPQSTAGRKPGHNMIIRGKGTPGGLVGTCSGEAHSSQCGRAEPAPPRGGPSRARWPCGENPGITRKAIFSEILCWVVKPPWFRESGLPGNETLG